MKYVSVFLLAMIAMAATRPLADRTKVVLGVISDFRETGTICRAWTGKLTLHGTRQVDGDRTSTITFNVSTAKQAKDADYFLGRNVALTYESSVFPLPLPCLHTERIVAIVISENQDIDHDAAGDRVAPETVGLK